MHDIGQGVVDGPEISKGGSPYFCNERYSRDASGTGDLTRLWHVKKKPAQCEFPSPAFFEESSFFSTAEWDARRLGCGPPSANTACGRCDKGRDARPRIAQYQQRV